MCSIVMLLQFWLRNGPIANTFQIGVSFCRYSDPSDELLTALDVVKDMRGRNSKCRCMAFYNVVCYWSDCICLSKNIISRMDGDLFDFMHYWLGMIYNKLIQIDISIMDYNGDKRWSRRGIFGWSWLICDIVLYSVDFHNIVVFLICWSWISQ